MGGREEEEKKEEGMVGLARWVTQHFFLSFVAVDEATNGQGPSEKQARPGNAHPANSRSYQLCLGIRLEIGFMLHRAALLGVGCHLRLGSLGIFARDRSRAHASAHTFSPFHARPVHTSLACDAKPQQGIV